MSDQIYKLPLVLRAEPEGGYTVTSPLLPELVTAGATVGEAIDNVQDALAAVVELYEDMHKPLPESLRQSDHDMIAFEHVVVAG